MIILSSVHPVVSNVGAGAPRSLSTGGVASRNQEVIPTGRAGDERAGPLAGDQWTMGTKATGMTIRPSTCGRARSDDLAGKKKRGPAQAGPRPWLSRQ